jgi:hypothetical protein
MRFLKGKISERIEQRPLERYSETVGQWVIIFNGVNQIKNPILKKG